MTCANCTKQDAERVILMDGTECCSWCEAWRHDTEARAILAMPTLKQRRAFLYGVVATDAVGRKISQRVTQRGVLQIRGEAEVKRLERTMTAMWNAQQGKTVA